MIIAHDKKLGQMHTARSIGHFEMHQMTLDGTEMRDFVRINTNSGLILNCDIRIEPAHVTRMAEMARLNPDYPYDLCAFIGSSGSRKLVWNARIYWRTK